MITRFKNGGYYDGRHRAILLHSIDPKKFNVAILATRAQESAYVRRYRFGILSDNASFDNNTGGFIMRSSSSINGAKAPGVVLVYRGGNGEFNPTIHTIVNTEFTRKTNDAIHQCTKGRSEERRVGKEGRS